MLAAVAFPVLAFATFAAAASPEATPPHGTLSVAYRQMADGKLSESVHHVELRCWDAHCSLTILTLNQCMESSAGLAFYPKIQRSSTDNGDLTVRRRASGVVEVEEVLDEARFLYRFSYRERNDPPLAQQVGLSSSRFFGPLTGFSGSVVKNSDVLGKVVSWDMVPLKGEWAFLEAKCRIMLDGVPE